MTKAMQGLSNRRRPGRSRTDHRQRPQNPGARRCRALRSSGQANACSTWPRRTPSESTSARSAPRTRHPGRNLRHADRARAPGLERGASQRRRSVHLRARRRRGRSAGRRRRSVRDRAGRHHAARHGGLHRRPADASRAHLGGDLRHRPRVEAIDWSRSASSETSYSSWAWSISARSRAS
jgi:hypothetical protein